MLQYKWFYKKPATLYYFFKPAAICTQMHFDVVDLQLLSLTRKCKTVQNRTAKTDMADFVLTNNSIPDTDKKADFLSFKMYLWAARFICQQKKQV